MQSDKGLAAVLGQHEGKVLQEWTSAMQEVRRHGGPGGGRDGHAQARGFLAAFTTAILRSSDPELIGDSWDNVRALLAERRAIRSSRMHSTNPVAVLGAPVAEPDSTARAAAMASTVSVLPCRRRS